MTILAIRTLVRRDLKDEDSNNYRWTDNEIDRAIQRALYDLSRAVPREMKSTVATTSGSRQIDISNVQDIHYRVRIDRVEFPIDQTPRNFPRFALYQNIITLIGDEVGDGSNCYIYWGALHTIDSQTNTVPAYLYDVLTLGAAAYAVLSHSQYRTDTASFGGERADADYFQWGQATLKQFHQQLKHYSRSSRLRISRFYQGDDYE